MKSFSNIDNFTKKEPSKFFYGLVFGFGGGFISGLIYALVMLWDYLK